MEHLPSKCKQNQKKKIIIEQSFADIASRRRKFTTRRHRILFLALCPQFRFCVFPTERNSAFNAATHYITPDECMSHVRLIKQLKLHFVAKPTATLFRDMQKLCRRRPHRLSPEFRTFVRKTRFSYFRIYIHNPFDGQRTVRHPKASTGEIQLVVDNLSITFFYNPPRRDFFGGATRKFACIVCVCGWENCDRRVFRMPFLWSQCPSNVSRSEFVWKIQIKTFRSFRKIRFFLFGLFAARFQITRQSTLIAQISHPQITQSMAIVRCWVSSIDTQLPIQCLRIVSRRGSWPRTCFTWKHTVSSSFVCDNNLKA